MVVNGRIKVSFHGAKGHIDDYHVSPLLFLLVIGFISMALATFTLDTWLRFHPRCKFLKLIMFSFSNDFLLFCPDHKSYVEKKIGMLKHFSITNCRCFKGS